MHTGGSVRVYGVPPLREGLAGRRYVQKRDGSDGVPYGKRGVLGPSLSQPGVPKAGQAGPCGIRRPGRFVRLFVLPDRLFSQTELNGSTTVSGPPWAVDSRYVVYLQQCQHGTFGKNNQARVKWHPR